jgi:TonB family protein
MKLRSISRLGHSWTIAICLLTLLAGSVLGQEGRRVISQPTPIYPQLARKSGLSGTVKVQVVIATDGTIKDVKVVGGHPLFIDAALDALKKWKYAPSSSETTTVLEFNFHP